jgi:hypothetical protein
MFARSVSVHLKPNSIAEFTQLIEKEAVPTLRKQKGFKDAITMVVPGGAEALAISLWETKENAEAYNRESYQGILKALGKVIEGTPQVRTYEVANSTSHKITAHIAVHA